MYDEIYQFKLPYSRDKIRVLMSVDPSTVDLANKNVHRTDKDFAVTWAHQYGKGRVFYSSLGHTRESWQDPQVQTMYLEAIRWVLGGSEGSTATHAKR